MWNFSAAINPNADRQFLNSLLFCDFHVTDYLYFLAEGRHGEKICWSLGEEVDLSYTTSKEGRNLTEDV